MGDRRIYETRGGPDNLALVLVAHRQRSDDTRGPRGDLGGRQGAVSKELGRLEGVGDVGGGATTRGGLVVVIFFWLGTAVVSGLLVTAHKHGPNNCTFI
jgi:hypothetical protein